MYALTQESLLRGPGLLIINRYLCLFQEINNFGRMFLVYHNYIVYKQLVYFWHHRQKICYQRNEIFLQYMVKMAKF